MAPKKEKDIPRKEDDSKPRRRRQYAFDDIAALNKGVTPSMATKDDFVLAYKTSSNKVQYICDTKDLLLPWAQILTARLKAAGRLGSILETETEPKTKCTTALPSLVTTTSDLTYFTEGSIAESGLETSDAMPHGSVMNFSDDILQKQIQMPPERTTSTEEIKYDTDIEKLKYLSETNIVPDESTTGVQDTSGESKFGMEMASYSKDIISEAEKDRITVTEDDEFRKLGPNVYGPIVGIKKTKFTMVESSDPPYTAFPVEAEEELLEDPDVISAEARPSTDTELPPQDKPKFVHEVREIVDTAKTKGLETDTKVIKWGKNELVDYRVSICIKD